MTTAKPLIVTPTFVSRVDDTARGERPQDSGSGKSTHGHEVHLPSWRPHALALDGDPNLAFEHWDEYWRKVHGPKFAWDGLAYIAYAEQDDIESTLGQEKFAKRIIADEQTAFRMVTREITEEFVLIPIERHRDPISLIRSACAGPILAFASMNDVEDYPLATITRPSRQARTRCAARDRSGGRRSTTRSSTDCPPKWSPSGTNGASVVRLGTRRSGAL